MRKTYWMLKPGMAEPELVCLDESQVGAMEESGARLKRDDYCALLDGALRGTRGQEIPKPSPEEEKRRRGRRR